MEMRHIFQSETGDLLQASDPWLDIDFSDLEKHKSCWLKMGASAMIITAFNFELIECFSL